MSREIKFRAWVEPNVGMTPYMNYDPEFIGHINDIFSSNGVKPVNRCGSKITYLQFTGLRDSKRTEEYPNGQEIYEGDYLRCKKYIGGNFVEYCYELGYVEFIHGAFGLHRKQGFYRPFKDWLEDYELEVIGNIYENPELLEIGKEEIPGNPAEQPGGGKDWG